jgi:hypothetical protein
LTISLDRDAGVRPAGAVCAPVIHEKEPGDVGSRERKGAAAVERGVVVSIYELDIGWATTENERRYLQWELLACDEVRGVFHTDRTHRLAVLCDGDRFDFQAFARSLAVLEATE